MDRPLSFCMINTFYPPYSFGGDGIFVHRLANELVKRGHKADVIHCIDSYRLGAGHDPITAYDDHPNVTVHGITSPFGFLSPLATHQTDYPLFKSAHIFCSFRVFRISERTSPNRRVKTALLPFCRAA